MADEKLFSFRITFIENASEGTLNKLADDLLSDKVLNDQEKESLMRSNRYEKASNLIDLVRKKGKKASSMMIAHLQKRDPRLYSQLDPTAELPAQSGLTVIHDELTYPVCLNHTRLALLINNVNFNNGEIRYGADKDQENMEDLLKYLQYTVVKYRDLTATDIDETVQNFARHPDLSQADSVFVIIMSHGKMGAICGIEMTNTNPDEFPIDKIFEYLNTANCPALLNKPKVVIIQACRGEIDGSVLVHDSPGDPTSGQLEHTTGPSDEEELEDDNYRHEHKEKDFIAFLSCTKDTVSYRDKNKGSIMIQYIAEIFKAHADVDHIEDMFMKVMIKFEKDFPSKLKKQMPTKERCTLTKHFYILGPR